MYAYNVTIQGSTRRIFASNVRGAIGTALRGATWIRGEAYPFEKMNNLTIGAVRESSKVYRSIKFAGLQRVTEAELRERYGWRAGFEHEGSRYVRTGQERSLILGAGDEQGQNAGLGLGLVAAEAEATHVAAYTGYKILKLVEITPELRAEAATLGGSKS